MVSRDQVGCSVAIRKPLMASMVGLKIWYDFISKICFVDAIWVDGREGP